MRITHYSRLLGMNIMMFIFGITLGQPHALGTDETPKSRMVHVVIHVERWDAGPVESYAIRMGDGENWQCCATNEVGDAHFTFDLPYGTSRLYACYPTEDDLKSLPREIPSRHPKVSYNLNSNYYFPQLRPKPPFTTLEGKSYTIPVSDLQNTYTLVFVAEELIEISATIKRPDVLANSDQLPRNPFTFVRLSNNREYTRGTPFIDFATDRIRVKAPKGLARDLCLVYGAEVKCYSIPSAEEDIDLGVIDPQLAYQYIREPERRIIPNPDIEVKSLEYVTIKSLLDSKQIVGEPGVYPAAAYAVTLISMDGKHVLDWRTDEAVQLAKGKFGLGITQPWPLVPADSYYLIPYSFVDMYPHHGALLDACRKKRDLAVEIGLPVVHLTPDDAVVEVTYDPVALMKLINDWMQKERDKSSPDTLSP
jgi:hypothetical protein